MSASRERKQRKEQLASLSEMDRKAAKKEKKSDLQLKIWSIVFCVFIGLAVVGILAAGVLNSGVLQRALPAVQVGEHSVSPAEMNFFYRDTVNNAMNSTNSLLPYLIQKGVSLDEQVYNEDQSWADYFLDAAVDNAKNTYAMYDAAVAAGFQLTEEQQQQMESDLKNMEAYSAMYQFSSPSAMLRANYGTGCNMKNYTAYINVQQLATAYAANYLESLEYDDAAIRAFDEEDPTAYNSYDYHTYMVRVEGYYPADAGTEGEDGQKTYTEEETKAAMEQAKKVADKMAADCKGDAELFTATATELANEGKTDEQKTETTTLHEKTLKANMSGMPEDLINWLVDASRKTGETTVVANGQLGYYVAMYVGVHDNTDPTINVRHILIQAAAAGTQGDTATSTQTATAAQQGRTPEEAKAEIEALKEEFEENPTEDNFAKLANEHSEDPGSNTNGGLYENVAPGQMVTNFNDWCFDESRKAGDVDIVETENGYHLMYFVGNGEHNYRDTMIVNALTQKDYQEWYNSITEPVTGEKKLGMRLVDKNIVLNSQSSSN